MKSKIIFLLVVVLTICYSPGLLFPQTIDEINLKKTFNLAGKKSVAEQFYIMETNFTNIELNGKRSGNTVYKLFLKCKPSELNDEKGDEYICSKFTISTNDSNLVSIPALKNWSYIFNQTANDLDKKGQVLGIDHAKFENLTGSNGKKISQEQSYLVYNTFIDFHTFCNVFAEKTSHGKGIQDLKKIGDKIIHASANTKPPVDLGSNVSKGSYFKNGEVTLLFKGLSLVNDKTCALAGFDSGVSSFYMKMQPSKDVTIETNGGSHYKGDIYIDLNSYWVQKVIMDEFVVAETKLPFPPNIVNSVTERNTLIRNVSKEEFNKERY